MANCAPLCLLLLAGVARAGTLEVTSASPDVPAVEVGWRLGVRAKAGARIALVSPPAGASGALVEVPFFIELHNRLGASSVVPYQLWRARVGLFGGYRWRWSDWRVDALAAVEHESDHITGPNAPEFFSGAGFVALNDVALAARARRLVHHPLAMQLTSRLHVLTCTSSPEDCGRGLGRVGDQTLEVSLDASQEFTLDDAARWALFAAVAGDALIATARIAPGRRVALRLGVLWRRTGQTLSLSLYGLAGSDVGYARQADTLQAGLQLAWAPGDEP